MSFTAATANHFLVMACMTAIFVPFSSSLNTGNTSYDVERKSRAIPEHLFCTSNHGDFSYDPKASNGPSHWGNVSECCQGAYQSPIPVSTQAAQGSKTCSTVATPKYYPTGGHVIFGKLYDTGHTIKLDFSNSSSEVYLSGVGLLSQQGTQYVLHELHFHFGNKGSSRGSEHTWDGRSYDGEIHLVHYNKKYGSVAKALSYEDGLAVVAIPLQYNGGERKRQLQQIVLAMPKLVKVGSVVSQVELKPERLLPSSRDLYYYKGSLTTPPCSEAVQFLVMKNPLKVTGKMLRIMRKVPSSEPGIPISEHTNIRPLQNSSGRIVRTNFNC